MQWARQRHSALSALGLVSSALSGCASAESPSISDASALGADASADVTDAALDADNTSEGDASVDAAPATARVFISEVVDATATGGAPKFVELTNSGSAAASLSNFSVGTYNNGNTTLANNSSIVLAGSLAPGDSFVLSLELEGEPGNSIFLDTYEVEPDQTDNNHGINGNDVVVLFAADGSGTGGAATGTGDDATLLDSFGIVGVDGSSQPWEYTDGYANRALGVVTPSPAFSLGQWTFSGVDALEGLSLPADRRCDLAGNTLSSLGAINLGG